MILHFIVIITMIVSHYDTDEKLYNFELFEPFYNRRILFTNIFYVTFQIFSWIKTQLLHKDTQLSMYRD